MTVSSNHYVPILLTRQGERTALQNIPEAVRASFTPVFMAHPIDWDFDKEQPKKDVDAHLQNLPVQLFQAWGTRPAFLDMAFIGDSPLADGRHPLDWFTQKSSEGGLVLTPVVSPSRTPEYVDAVSRAIQRDGVGACLRLSIDEWPGIGGPASVNGLLNRLGISAAETDLLLDLGDDVDRAGRAAMRAELSALPNVDQWRSLIVAGTGMPPTMPAGQGVHIIERQEWQIYVELRETALRDSKRVPTFSDYAIANPNPAADINPRLMSISATLRYASGDSWLIAKGGLFKGTGGRSLGGAAVGPIAQTLTTQPGYQGPAHCAFEKWIEDAVDGANNGGSPQTWRRYGTQHHIQLATEQISSLDGF